MTLAIQTLKAGDAEAGDAEAGLSRISVQEAIVDAEEFDEGLGCVDWTIVRPLDVLLGLKKVGNSRKVACKHLGHAAAVFVRKFTSCVIDG